MVAQALICLVLAFDPSVSGDPGITRPAVPRVRAMSSSARLLLADALERSATVASLVRALEARHVFVFVDTRVDPDIPTAQTALLASNETGRYVHVVLNPALTLNRRIELLGHELQHAFEIACAENVTDAGSFRRHYREVGRQISPANQRAHSYETDAAHDVELRVRRELSTRGGPIAPR